MKTFDNGFFIKITVTFYDNSLLYISEYIDEEERNYSYHWQDKNNSLIMRFDNAPYHPYIKTFPHHIHKNNVIHENTYISFKEILIIIEKQYYDINS